jgi:hypothetical protein
MPTVARWLLAAALALVLVPGVRAQMADDDGDGVDDAVDECIDTPPGDMVDAAGCSVCDCDGTAAGAAWASHAAYLRCVVHEAKARHAAGRLARRAYRAQLRHARASTCGNDALTRCCVHRTDGAAGHCRIVGWAACDADTLHVFDASDEDSGSCLPSPCE